MKFIRGVIKFSLFFLMILIFLAHHFVMNLIHWNEESRLKSISSYCRLGLKILNVKIDKKSPENLHGKLIVSNHLSYLDVLIYFASFPSLFVTSNEIRETFLLGDICKLAGCFFIERRAKLRTVENRNKELADINKKLKEGFNIFLFPEGTSSDGKNVLPFKGNFFQVAVESKAPIVPITLKYQGGNAHLVPWYGEMTFPDHLFSLCMEKQLNAAFSVLPDVYGKEKMALAKLTHEMISEAYEKN